jgi:acetyl esterase/lipase
LRITNVILLSLIVFLPACNKPIINQPTSGGLQVPVSNPLPEIRINNIPYGTNPSQILDFFLPQGRTTGKTKLIVLVHGGQWVGGDKTDMEGYISLLKSRLPDFAFANINYRLINGNTILINELLDDIKLAVEFLMSKSDSFSISKKTVLLGESAGAQLSLVNAYKINSTNIKAVIGIKSPTHFSEWYNTAQNPQIKPMLEFITGGTPQSIPQLYNTISPISHPQPGDPATLMIHGDADGFVLTQQAVVMTQKLNNCGVFNQLSLLSGESHAFSLNAQLLVYEIITQFLNNPQIFR